MVDFSGGTPFRNDLVVSIGGERYLVLTDPETGSRQWVNRPVPVQEGEREPEYPITMRSFHEGGGFSYAGMANVYEYANGWDASAPGKITTWARHATGAAFDSGLEYKGWVVLHAGRMYVLRGRYAYWYTPGTSAGVEWSSTLSKDFGAGMVVSGRPASFKGKLYVPVSNASTGADQQFWELTSTGSPDTWNQSGDASLTARAFYNWHNPKTGAAVLVRADEGSAYTVAGRPRTVSDWSAEQQIGDPGHIVTDFRTWQDMLIPLKENGLYSVSAIVVALNELPDLESSEDTLNGVGSGNYGSFCIVPHKSGLIRWQPGQYRFIGPNQEGAMEADISPGWGRVNHVVAFGKYLFATANDTVNEVGAVWAFEPPRGERGPLVPHCFHTTESGYYDGMAVVQDSNDTASYLVALHVSGTTVTPHVWQLPRHDYNPGTDPSIVKARDDAQFFTPRYWQPGREVQKSWRAVEFYLEASPETNTPGLEIYARVDGGSAIQLLNSSGNPATLRSSGFHRVFFPKDSTAIGDYVQLEFRIPAKSGGEVDVAMTLRDCVLRLDLQPELADSVSTTLVLGAGEFEDVTSMRRAAWTQLQDLKDLQGRQTAATLIKDPWGKEWYGNVMVDNWREAEMPGHSQPTFLADITIRRRPYA